MSALLTSLLVTGCSLCALASVALASDAPTEGSNADRVTAVWYADNSCRLRVGNLEEIGVTSIDADMAEAGARTLIHCDTDSGRRLTLMTIGSGLTLGERKELQTPEALEDAVDGCIAWITRIDQQEEQDVPDEIAARRFLTDGQAIIRETPGIDTVESALYVDRQGFAQVRGVLEPPAARPRPSEDGAKAAADAQPSRVATRRGLINDDEQTTN